MKTYIARQPVLDTYGDTVGYELLFRHTKTDTAEILDDDLATLKVIKDLVISFGSQKLTNDKRAFVKFTPNLIKGNILELFRSEKLIIELSDFDIEDQALVDAIHSYKSKGYLFSCNRLNRETMKVEKLALMDMFKIDFSRGNRQQIAEIIKALKPYKKVFHADKVENEADYEMAKSMGFTFFQGYFFQKPTLLESPDTSLLPSVYFELLRTLNEEVVDYDHLADTIKTDTGLTLSVLKLINTAAYYANSKVTSIKSALIRLGQVESRRLMMINMLKVFALQKGTHELIIMSLKRGKIAEDMASYYGLKSRKDELFLVGLLSLINIILKRPMDAIMADVPLQEDVISALLGEDNALSQVLEVIILHELEAYDQVQERLNTISCPLETFNKLYFEGCMWADALMQED